MYGAILGDIIGSAHDFTGYKSKDFPLFHEKSYFSDDTVLTVAVAEALLDTMGESDGVISQHLFDSLRKWGNDKYPYSLYGGGFVRWLESDNPKPYYSNGNGAAMRVSSAGWLFNTIEETRRIAGLTAAITHNHPEGIKGAQSVASAIFLARTGKTKEEIMDYIVKEFGYDLSQTLDEIRPAYQRDESCEGSVPQAIISFLESTSFEDAVRNAVSLGGDADTLACIAGSIAEAFYGISFDLKKECIARLPVDMIEVIGRFEEYVVFH